MNTTIKNNCSISPASFGEKVRIATNVKIIGKIITAANAMISFVFNFIPVPLFKKGTVPFLNQIQNIQKTDGKGDRHLFFSTVT